MKPRRSSEGRGAAYVFRLFVAGNESNSLQAASNLMRLCDQYLPGRHTIHTVDVMTHGEIAYKNNVLVTPTLVLVKPLPTVRVIGNLRDTAQVLAALRLIGIR